MSQSSIIVRAGAGVGAGPQRVVHLELHTGDIRCASDFYTRLLSWRAAPIETKHGRYLALGLAGELTGGMVECATRRPLWLPYVEVDSIGALTERALRLGASVLLGPREGPAGWRSVISAPGAGELALWQPKEWP